MADSISPEMAKTIAELAMAGNKIEAIKLYRDQTGHGLKEAKEFIEALEGRLRGERMAAQAGETAPDVMQQIEERLFAGRKIEAIKMYREHSGLGLKEAKDFVDVKESELRAQQPGRFTAPPSAAGCGRAAAIVVTAVVAAVIAVVVLLF